MKLIKPTIKVNEALVQNEYQPIVIRSRLDKRMAGSPMVNIYTLMDKSILSNSWQEHPQQQDL